MAWACRSGNRSESWTQREKTQEGHRERVHVCEVPRMARELNIDSIERNHYHGTTYSDLIMDSFWFVFRVALRVQVLLHCLRCYDGTCSVTPASKPVRMLLARFRRLFPTSATPFETPPRLKSEDTSKQLEPRIILSAFWEPSVPPMGTA